MPAAASDMRNLPKLTKYDLLEEIGHGGMATVYRAHDPRLKRDVAVKVLHRHLLDSTEVAHRFRAEAQAVAKLRHPNILEVYDVAAEDEREKYLVVELLRGESLRQLLRRTGALPPEVAAAIGIELLAALQHAHGQGVIHRDIKPENIMVDIAAPTREGEEEDASDASFSASAAVEVPASRIANDVGAPSSRPATERATPSSKRLGPKRVSVKLMDFGIAKLLDVQGVTSTGQVLGSPAHMAPEQIEGAEVDARADVFAVGIVLYEAMTGELPFRGQNPAQVLQRVLRGEFTRVDVKAPKVGACIGSVVSKALARDRDVRFASAKALRDALRAELVYVGYNDPRQLLVDFFDDPAGFVPAFETALKATLCRRGQEAQSAGDALKAGSAYNRALAYAPDDMVLLRTVATMRKRAILARRLRQSWPIALGMVVLGASAFGITRTVRASRAAEYERAQANARLGTTNAASIGATARAARAEADKNALARVGQSDAAPNGSPSGPAGGTTAGPALAVTKGLTSGSSATPTVASATGTAKREGRRVLQLGRVQPTTGVQLSVDEGPVQSVSDGSQIVLDGGPHDLRFTCASDLCEPQTSHLAASDRDTELAIELRLKAATLLVEGSLERHYQLDKFPDLIVRAGIPARVPVRRGDESVVVTELETGLQKSILLPPGKTARLTFNAN
jgi:eukaryotic-like serine/threonine-protein kinase